MVASAVVSLDRYAVVLSGVTSGGNKAPLSNACAVRVSGITRVRDSVHACMMSVCVCS